MEDTPMVDAPSDDVDLPMHSNGHADPSYGFSLPSSSPPRAPQDPWERTQRVEDPLWTDIIDAFRFDEEELEAEWGLYRRGLTAIEPYPEPGIEIIPPRDLKVDIDWLNDDEEEEYVLVTRRSSPWQRNIAGWSRSKRCFAFRGELRLLVRLVAFLQESMPVQGRIKTAYIRTRHVSAPLSGVNVGLSRRAFTRKVTIVECALMVQDGIDIDGHELLMNGRNFLSAAGKDVARFRDDHSDGSDDAMSSSPTLVNDTSSPIPDEVDISDAFTLSQTTHITRHHVPRDASSGLRAPANSAANSSPPYANDGSMVQPRESGVATGRYNLRNRSRPSTAATGRGNGQGQG